MKIILGHFCLLVLLTCSKIVAHDNSKGKICSPHIISFNFVVGGRGSNVGFGGSASVNIGGNIVTVGRGSYSVFIIDGNNSAARAIYNGKFSIKCLCTIPGVPKKRSCVFQLFSKNAPLRYGIIGLGSNRFLIED